MAHFLSRKWNDYACVVPRSQTDLRVTYSPLESLTFYIQSVTTIARNLLAAFYEVKITKWVLFLKIELRVWERKDRKAVKHVTVLLY